MDAGRLEATLEGGRQGIGNAQEGGALAHHPIHRGVVGPVEGLGIRIVVHVHLEALHLAIVRGHKHVPLQGQRVAPLLALQVLTPTGQDSRELGPSIGIVLRREERRRDHH